VLFALELDDSLFAGVLNKGTTLPPMPVRVCH
jgi:hypothetical protein